MAVKSGIISFATKRYKTDCTQYSFFFLHFVFVFFHFFSPNKKSLTSLKPFSPQDQVKKWNFGHLRNLSLPLKKRKKSDLRGQKGSMQWKDAKDVLVKQKQLGEVP